MRRTDAVKNRVEQSGVEAEVSRRIVLLFGQRRLDKDLLSVTPGIAQPLERGPVLKADLRQPVIQLIQVEPLRTGRWPNSGEQRHRPSGPPRISVQFIRGEHPERVAH